MINFSYNPHTLGFLGASPGPFEILILLAAVLVLFGANRLPELFRTLGRFSSELKKASDDFRYQLMEIPEEVTSIKQEIEDDLRDLTVSRTPPDYDVEEEADFHDADGPEPDPPAEDTEPLPPADSPDS